jgi:sodium transport system permease protein
VPAVLAIAATAVYAALALVFASRAFGREDVLFGTGGAVVSAREKRARRRREGAVPAPAAALGVVALAGALFFYGGRIAVMSLGEVGVILTQLLFLAVPALLLIRVGGYSAKETLSLRLPDGRTTAAAALIMAGGIPLGWLVSWLQGFVLEMPLEFLQALRGFVTADSLPRLMWLLLIAAVTPAICEELVFRGVVLRAFGSRMKPWAAIGASALLFGAFHLSNETAIRFLPTAWLGLLVGYTVWHSRSIFTGMLMHVMNNGLVIVLLSVPVLRERFSETGNVPPWLLVAVAPVLLGVGLWLLPRRDGGARKEHADVRIMDSVRAGAAVPAAQLPAA